MTTKLANPCPLGLLGFGMTTVLLNLHNAVLLPLSIAIVAMGYYLLLWGIFTLFMFIGTLKHNKATQVVFGSLTILFMLLALGDFTGNHTITTIAGFEGIFCGLSAIYSAMGQILNAEYGKEVMPLG